MGLLRSRRRLLGADALPVGRARSRCRRAADGRGFRGVTLAYNVHSQERVDEVLAEAAVAGATITKAPTPTEWGGYSGYFADPEGQLWEVATGATQLPFSE